MTRNHRIVEVGERPVELLVTANRIGQGTLISQAATLVRELGIGGFATVIVRSADLRAIGPLVELLSPDVGRKVRHAAAEALVRLLPLVGPDDASVLAESSVHHFLAHPESWQPGETRVVCSALEATSRAGDTAAIPYIESLLCTRASLPPHVVDAAANTLLALRRAAADIEAHGQLLRPVEDPAAILLVRPASPADAESRTLVRPTEGALAEGGATLLRPAPQDLG